MENKKVFGRLLQIEFFKEARRNCILKEFLLSPIKKTQGETSMADYFTLQELEKKRVG